MALNTRLANWLTVAGILLTVTDILVAQTDQGNWQEITAIPDAKTHLVPRTWTLDKYPDAPTLMPHSKVTVLDQDGPGVVTNNPTTSGCRCRFRSTFASRSRTRQTAT